MDGSSRGEVALGRRSALQTARRTLATATAHLRSNDGESQSPHYAMLADSLFRYAAEQAMGLRETGVEVTFFYIDRLTEFDGNRGDREIFIKALEEAGIATIALPRRDLRRLHTQTAGLLKEMRQRAVTIIVAQAHYDPRYLLASLRYPTALVVHDPKPHSGDTDYPRWPAPMVARLSELVADCIVLHSSRLVPQADRVIRAAPIVIVPHGVAPRTSLLPKPEAPTIVLVGRLHAYKGVETLLEAFRLVRRNRPDVGLVIAGRGSLTEHLEGLREPGVTAELGYVTEERIDELLRAATVVCLPYTDATQSGVGLLAIGRGVPVVVTAAGALPDLIEDVDPRFIAPPSDPPALAAALEMALEHTDELRSEVLSHAGQFAWPMVAKTLRSQLAAAGIERGGRSEPCHDPRPRDHRP